MESNKRFSKAKKNGKQTEPACRIDRFDMSKVGDGVNCVFIGKKKTGKSVLVLDYLWHNRRIPKGMVISETDRYNLTFQQHVPSRFIYEEFDKDLVKSFIKCQKKIVGRKRSKKKKYAKYNDIDTRVFLIFDDCLASVDKWKGDPTIKWIFMNGRHIDVTFLITMQDPMGIPPKLRTNVDYIFICKEPKKTNRRKLYEHWCGIIDTFSFFELVMKKCTSNFRCLVVDNNSISSKLSKQLFWYKAEIHKTGWKTCYDDFWKNNEDYIPKDSDDDTSSDGSYDEPDMSEDEFQQFLPKKRGANINVKMRKHKAPKRINKMSSRPNRRRQKSL